MKTRIAFAVAFGIAFIANLYLSVPFLLTVFRREEVLRSIMTVSIWLLFAAAVVLQVGGHIVRAHKHALLLQEIRPIKRTQVFRGQMIGFMFNALLPWRVGELLRAHYVGRTVQISRSAVFATIMFERAIDLFVVAGLGTVALLCSGSQGAVAFDALVIGAWLLCVLVSLVLLVAYRQPRWFLSTVYSITGVFNQEICNRGRQIAWSFSHALLYALPNRGVLRRYLVASVSMWLAYLASVFFVILAAGRALPSFAAGTALVDSPYLGVTTSTGPAFFGAFSSRFNAVAEVWLPVGSSPSVLVLLVWALLVLPSIVIGIICLAHPTLVEHVDGTTVSALMRNKLFRELDTSREFANLLSAHFQGEELGRQVSREEALGHFTVVRPLKGGSHASTLLVWQQGRLIVKKITLPEYRSKLESQYKWLHDRAHLPNVVNVLDRHDGKSFYSIDIEYRENYVSFFEQLHAATKDDAWSVLERVLDFGEESMYVDSAVDEREHVFNRYLSTKVVDKVIDAAALCKDISQLMGYDTLIVNGVRYENLLVVLDRIRGNPDVMRDLLEFRTGPVHGDLTIDNMMVDPSTMDFMLIDPNDENLISDRVVDYGKLLQSLHSGYEFFLLHDTVEVESNHVSFEERRSAHYEFLYGKCRARLVHTLDSARFRALLFHEAVHYTRMLTYRAAINSDSAALYFAVAVRLFNEFLTQYEEPSNSTVRRLGPPQRLPSAI